MGLLDNIFGKKEKNPICRAYKNGRCIPGAEDTGPCSWDPNNWESCGVVKSHLEFYGKW